MIKMKKNRFEKEIDSTKSLRDESSRLKFN